MSFENHSEWEIENIPEEAAADVPAASPAPEVSRPEELPQQEFAEEPEEEGSSAPEFIAFESMADTEDLQPSKEYTGRFAAPEPVQDDENDAASEPEQSREESEKPAEADDVIEESPYLTDFGIENDLLTDQPKMAEEPKKKKRAVKKGRPRRKSSEGLFGIPNILVTLVWCGLTLLISLTLGRMAWICAAEVLAFGRDDRNVTITIYENDTIDTITNKLAREGLINYPGLFKLYAKFAVDDGEIHPGMWDLNTKYDYHALVKMMSPSSSRSVVKVLIPEGYSCRQIFALLEENKVCTAKDIAAYAENGELGDYWFLEGVVRDNKYCLEGFLFPDTYEFYQNDSPKSVLTKMLNNFDKRFDETMRAQIQTLNNTLADLMRRDGRSQDYINAHLFTVRDVVNVASMIEKETSSAQEGHKIASVIYNRLFYWHGTPAYLNIDATIIYALDGKTDLTAEDLRVDSPYNTYTNIGLTPGPISNPGLSSLQAALQPESTQYYFYVLDPTTGSHIFATTQAEHDANRAKVGG